MGVCLPLPPPPPLLQLLPLPGCPNVHPADRHRGLPGHAVCDVQCAACCLAKQVSQPAALSPSCLPACVPPPARPPSQHLGQARADASAAPVTPALRTPAADSHNAVCVCVLLVLTSAAAEISDSFWNNPSTRRCTVLRDQYAKQWPGATVNLPCINGSSVPFDPAGALYLIAFAISASGSISVPRYSSLTYAVAPHPPRCTPCCAPGQSVLIIPETACTFPQRTPPLALLHSPHTPHHPPATCCSPPHPPPSPRPPSPRPPPPRPPPPPSPRPPKCATAAAAAAASHFGCRLHCMCGCVRRNGDRTDLKSCPSRHRMHACGLRVLWLGISYDAC